MRELGDLLVHGVAIRPGHPVILGVARGKALIGVPGYPVSAILTTELFVKPLLYKLQEHWLMPKWKRELRGEMHIIVHYFSFFNTFSSHSVEDLLHRS